MSVARLPYVARKIAWPQVKIVGAGFLACLAWAGCAIAAGTGNIVISNEKSSTLTILDASDTVVKTIETCARPRGMHFSADRTQFYVGCADDDQIAIYDMESLELVGRILDVEEPETFDLHPDGRRLVISNEEDATATLFDVVEREFLAEFETGEEPEGVLMALSH